MDVEIVGKFLSTLPEDDDHPYRTGPWRPQTTEWDADDLTVVDAEIDGGKRARNCDRISKQFNHARSDLGLA